MAFEAPKSNEEELGKTKGIEQKKQVTETKTEASHLEKKIKVGFVIDHLNASQPERVKESNLIVKNALIKVNTFDNVLKNHIANMIKSSPALPEDKVFDEANAKATTDFNNTIKKNPKEFTPTDMENIIVGIVLDMGGASTFDKNMQEKIANISPTEVLPNDIFQAVFDKCASFYARE